MVPGPLMVMKLLAEREEVEIFPEVVLRYISFPELLIALLLLMPPAE